VTKAPARLKAVLGYHVLPLRLASADVKPGNSKTAQGGNVALARAGAFVTVEDAMVQTPDIVATNGVVHVVDRVLMPPAAR
ncbi:MAG: fasciclin domain-containing protein, partial [Comamonadaceae bacterium]